MSSYNETTGTCTRLCKGECGETKRVDMFEVTLRNADGTVKSRRGVCKSCYAKSKAAKAKSKNKEIDRNTVKKPEKCVTCERPTSEVTFKWRDDIASGGWRNVCNDCYNAKGYSTISRARRRAEDEEGYLKKNAENHLAWSHRNQDKVAAQQRLNKTIPERRWKCLVTYVKQKHGEDWEKRVKLEDKNGLIERMSDACLYCGHKPKGDGEDELNGLDRVDPCGIYSLENTVSCCGVCNAMKLTYSTDEFINNVRRIYAKLKQDATHEDIMALSLMQRIRPLGHDKDRRNAACQKDKTCRLSEDDKIDLWSSECYLCGRSPAFGIDRVDANIGYEKDNCKPCCTQCNYMKKDWSLQGFLGHIVRIDMHTNMWVIGDTLDKASCIVGDRNPVSVVDEDGLPLLVFPSMHCAIKITGTRSIQQSLRTGVKCCGKRWKYESPRTYNQQKQQKTEVKHLILSLRSNKRS